MKKPNFTNTATPDAKMKVLLHSPSGIGKTRLASTFPNAVIFDFEDGTASIDAASNVQRIDRSQFMANGVFNPQLVLEYLDWFATKEADGVSTVVIDSITDLQEQFLEVTLAKYRDPRQAYGEWASFVRTMMTKLRALDKHFVVIARTKMGDNFEGIEGMLLPQISPAAWGNVPALVDYGFYMTRKRTGLGDNAKVVPVLVTQSQQAWTKTRRPMPTEIQNPTFASIQAVIAGE